MLLKANKYRKDKKADCRQNELGSRIFMGRVFGDYAECLHFYPSFSYGRIIAGERNDALLLPFRPQLPAVRAVSGLFARRFSTPVWRAAALILQKVRKKQVFTRVWHDALIEKKG